MRDVVSSDPFRGTAQRWSLDSGSLAGTACDHAFHEDWSLTWRMVKGPRQGEVGRAREFQVRTVRARLYLVAFPAAPGVFVTATVDFATRRLTGFRHEGGQCVAFDGSWRAL